MTSLPGLLELPAAAPAARRGEGVLVERDQRVELASLDQLPTVGIRTAIGRVVREDQVPAAAGIGISQRVLEPAQVEEAGIRRVGPAAGRRRQGREGRLRQRVDQLDEEPVGLRAADTLVVRVREREYLVEGDRVILHAILVQGDGVGRVGRGQDQRGDRRGRRRTSRGIRGLSRHEQDVRVLPVGHRAVRVAEIDDVDHELAELGQLFRSIDGPGGQDPLEELVRVGDPLPPDQLVGVVRDRQGIIEVDLSVVVGQGRRRHVRAQRGARRGEAGIGRRCESTVERERVLGVIVGPVELVRLPALDREQPATALAVDGVGEADRGQVGEPAQQRRAVDVLRPVEPFEIGGGEGGIHQGIGPVEVHLVGLVQPVGADAEVVGRIAVGDPRGEVLIGGHAAVALGRIAAVGAGEVRVLGRLEAVERVVGNVGQV